MRIVTIIPFLLVFNTGFAQESIGSRVASAAKKQIGVTVSYNPAYVKLKYPGGDVAKKTGVCTDVVVRALRAVGYDLQKLIHEDMKNNFSKYPDIWGLKRPDRNIDHRRVPNQMCWFKRKKWNIEISNKPGHYKAGDIVAWRLENNRLHIGIVSDKYAEDRKTPLVIHNIGAGAKEEDMLSKIIGVYRPK
jgi:uncharacterized protein YijF (DUF1287 family)